LVIGPGAHVNLVDLIDNGNRNGPAGPPEALYVGRLSFADPDSLLNLNGLHLYYDQLLGSPTQLLNQLLPGQPLPEPSALALFLLATPTLLFRRRRLV
jgi:hypothetical protein